MIRASILSALVLLGATTLLPSAAATPVRPCSDDVCVDVDPTGGVSVHPGEPKAMTFTLSVSGGDVQIADFSVDTGSGLSVVPDSLVLDGTAVAGTTYGADSLSATLATPATPLTAGIHRLRFDALASESIGDSSFVDTDFTFRRDPSAPQSGVGFHTTLQVPNDDYSLDLQIPNGAPLLAQPDSFVSVVGQYTGGIKKGIADLVIQVPAGLGTDVRGNLLTGDGLGAALSCTPRPNIPICRVPIAGDGGSVPFVVFLPTQPQVPVGTTGHVVLEIESVRGLPSDPNPEDNFAGFDVRFVAPTDLSYRFEHAVGDTPVGSTAQVTFTVTNDGTDPAPTLSGQFTFDPSLDEADPPFEVSIDGPGLYGGGGSQPFRIAPLAPGASATYRIGVTPNVADRTLTLAVRDDTFSPTPDCFESGCNPVATAFVTSAPGGPPLAETGSPVLPQALAAIGLLAVGGCLMLAGRRRRHG